MSLNNSTALFVNPRKVFSGLFLLVIVFFMSSCGGTMEPMTSTSQDGQMTVTVAGSQEAVAEPWMMTVVAERGGKQKTGVGVMWGTPDSNSVKFDWQDNHYCIVSFTSRDGEVTKAEMYIPD